MVKKTLDEYLDEVNYHDYSGYVPSPFALKFVNFIKLVTDGKGEESKTPVIHYKILDKYATARQNVLNICARGLGKSTLNRYLMLYLAVYNHLDNFGDVRYVLYVADYADNNVRNMREALELTYNNSNFLHQFVPTAKFIESEWYFKNREGKELVITAHAAQSGIRGVTRLNTRPQLALVDDLIKDDADARSPTIMGNIENTINKSIEHALHPTRRKIIWSGTPFNQSDPLYKAVPTGIWDVNVFPIAETFDMETTKETYVGAWNDRFPFDNVKESYLKSPSAFNQEMMLRVMSDEDRLVLDDDIVWYSREIVLKQKHNYHYYITTDFATSEKESSDFSVISVWAYDAHGDWLWVDGVVARQLMDLNVEKLFYFVKIYRPLLVGVEISGQQKGFISWLKSEMVSRNLFFNFAKNEGSSQEGIRPTTNKMVRFSTMIPLFKQKKILFPKELKDTAAMVEATNELRYATIGGFRSKHDDFIDTISQLQYIDAIKPEEVVELLPKTDRRYYNDDTDMDVNDISRRRSVVF